jgi:hypothetical protein
MSRLLKLMIVLSLLIQAQLACAATWQKLNIVFPGVTAGGACTTGQIGTTATGAILSCQSSVWTAVGGGVPLDVGAWTVGSFTWGGCSVATAIGGTLVANGVNMWGASGTVKIPYGTWRNLGPETCSSAYGTLWQRIN